MGKSDCKTPRSFESSTQSEEVEERKPNPPLILLSSDDGASEGLGVKTVEKSLLRACSNVSGNKNSSSALDSEVISIDVKKKNKKTKEMTGAQNNVEDTKKKEETIELIESDGVLEIDPVEKSDNVVLRKLLRGPRYFDPPDNNWGNCYNCGEAGHTVGNCTAAKRKKPCFVCGSFEHNAKQCKQGKDCFLCKKPGHRAKDCPEKSSKSFQMAKLCLKCGDSSHEMFTCKAVYSPDDLKEVQCYICKSFGHLCCVKYGKGPREVSCYICGQLGHTGLECGSSSTYSEITNTVSPKSCYKCGVDGHKARKCPSSTKKRKRKSEFSRHSKDNKDDIGVRSAPHTLGEGHKRNKTQNGYSTPYQPKHRGGWVNEHQGGYYHVNQRRSPSTPQAYQSNHSYHGNHSARVHGHGNGYGHGHGHGHGNGHGPGHDHDNGYGNGYGSGFQYEASGSNGYQRFSRSRFGDNGNYGRREYNWDY